MAMVSPQLFYGGDICIVLGLCHATRSASSSHGTGHDHGHGHSTWSRCMVTVMAFVMVPLSWLRYWSCCFLDVIVTVIVMVLVPVLLHDHGDGIHLGNGHRSLAWSCPRPMHVP